MAGGGVRALGVVVARASSKRVPRKVLREVAGHPLIAWMVRAALSSGLDRVVVSTEDAEVADVARRYGAEVPFLRPPSLAADTTRNDEVLLHALDAVEMQEGATYDVCVLLQSSAPFTQPADIDACVRVLAETAALNCAFAARRVRDQPSWMFREDERGDAHLLLGGELTGIRQLTQSLPPAFLPAGSVWAVRVASLRDRRAIYVPPYRLVHVPGERAVDVDEAIDLVFADAVARHFGFELLPVASRG